MAIRTAVVQEALTWLGQPDSVGVDDSTDPLVRSLRASFEKRALVLLESYPWNFARKVEQLALTASATGYEGWMYGFVKPAQCRRILKVDNQADMERRKSIDFEDRQGLICTNSEITFLAYVDGSYAVSDSGSWPEVVKTAFALDLADLHGGKIDLSGGKREELEARARRAMREARRWDAQQNQQQKPAPTYWQTSRLTQSNRRNG